jgi:alkylation response protein AidB-like acyl-CoA dehydrogenase
MSTQVSERQARDVAEAARETSWTLPSFGKELFLGNFKLDLIYPQPRLDPARVEEGEAFIAKLKSFLQQHVDPLEIEREAKLPEHVIEGLKEIGALGIKVAKEYGGLGLSQVYYNKALIMAGTYHASLATLLSAHQSIGLAEPLRMFGSEEQKREWLPKVATTHISAFMLTEPDVGSDPARLGATAELDDDEYVINGRKLWATNGVIADVVVVMARVGKKISAFIVPTDLPGITVEHRNKFMGLRGIENSVTRFDNVRIPKANLIGKEGEGLKIALSTLNTGRIALPAICVGVSKWATKVAREWGAERVQWGQPVGKHEAVAHKISYIAATAFGLEAMLDVTSRLADDKRNDIRIEAALAKLLGSEMGWQVVDELVQIRGGRGFETAESLAARGEKPVPVETAFRDMRINRIFEGSTEVMHLLIAREAVDQHLQVAGDILEPETELKDKAKAAVGAGAFYAKWFPSLMHGDGSRPGSYAEFGDLATHLRYVERASRKQARATFYAMNRYQAKMERKQAFLGRIVDIGSELYAIAAACVYAKTLEQERPELGEQARELADLFARQARRRADVLFEELWHNDDDLNTRRATGILEGRYTWVEEGVIDPSGDGPMIPSEIKTEQRDAEVASAGTGNGHENGQTRPANPKGDPDKDIRATA